MKLELTHRGIGGWGGISRGIADLATLGFLTAVEKRTNVLYAKLHVSPAEEASLKSKQLLGSVYDGSNLFNWEVGITREVTVHDLIRGVDIKVPPTKEAVVIAEAALELSALGLSEAMKVVQPPAASRQGPPSRTIDLD